MITVYTIHHAAFLPLMPGDQKLIAINGLDTNRESCFALQLCAARPVVPITGYISNSSVECLNQLLLTWFPNQLTVIIYVVAAE
jgi:hypothetical protein